MSKALSSGLITESSVSDALLATRGDLFLASAYLKVRPRELDSYIRASESLQAFVVAIGHVKALPEYDRLSTDQFADEMEKLTRQYRLEALDVIHEIATMEHSREEMTAAMYEVKLKAAIQLRGTVPEVATINQQSVVLQELNEIYQQAAPRIKSIRAVQIEYGN